MAKFSFKNYLLSETFLGISAEKGSSFGTRSLHENVDIMYAKSRAKADEENEHGSRNR